MRYLTRMLALAILGAGLLALPTHAHDVKDPVCRMTVDSDTAKYKHKLGNKSFYFCSKQCQVNFAKNPAKYEKLAVQLEKQDLHEYEALLETSSNPVAGKPVDLAFTIRYADTKKLVQDFEMIHERLFHLLLVSDDLSWFEHQHPIRGSDGIFRKTWTFPRPGNYTLYADFTPADGDNQVKPLPLVVGGGEARTYPLTPDAKRVKQVGDYRVELTLRPTAALTMEKPVILTYTVKDKQGRPLRNMQPFIGAPGHLIAISEDRKEVVHTHAIHGSAEPPMEKGAIHVTPAMSTEKGPAFSFKLTTPTSGLYKVWAQFMHRNRVITVPFTFLVQDLWARNLKSVAAKAAPKKAAGVVQKATVVIDGGYSPAKLNVKAGRPVQLTFVRKGTDGCGEVVQFPSLKLKRTLKKGEKTTVTFTPTKSGPLHFTCGMEMYRGQLVVR